MPVKLTAAARAEIVRRYRDGGETASAIARAFGVSVGYPRLLAKRAGRCAPGRSGLAPSARADIVRRWQAGEKAIAIAVDHGVSETTVRHYALQAGCARRPISQQSLDTGRIQAILADYRAGVPVRAIADRHAVHFTTVIKRARAAGLPPRHQHRRSRLKRAA